MVTSSLRDGLRLGTRSLVSDLSHDLLPCLNSSGVEVMKRLLPRRPSPPLALSLRSREWGTPALLPLSLPAVPAREWDELLGLRALLNIPCGS